MNKITPISEFVKFQKTSNYTYELSTNEEEAIKEKAILLSIDELEELARVIDIELKKNTYKILKKEEAEKLVNWVMAEVNRL